MSNSRARPFLLSTQWRAWLGLGQLALGMAATLFLPAGFGYVEGWVFWAVFLLCSALSTLYLQLRDPALLERRMKAGLRAEQRPRQQWIQALASFAFAVALLIPALDHRFGWSQLPLALVVVGNLLVGLGYFLVFRVLRENTFASAVVEIGAEQRVIDTGPYALVRHPMYSSALLMFVGIPLALGSLWGLCVLPLLLAVLAWRLLDEEIMLAQHLPGYEDYRRKVPYRLVPHLW